MNRYAQVKPMSFNFYTPPVEMLGKALEAAQQQYNTNFELADVIRNTIITGLPRDAKRAQEIQAEYSKAIDDIVSKYNGDYSQATNELYKLSNKVKQDLTTGEAGAIMSNYNAWIEATKRNQEKLSKGLITESQISQLNKYMDENFKGTVKDPKTNTWTKINIPELAEYVNGEELVLKAIEKVKPRVEVRTDAVPASNGIDVALITTTTEVIDKNEMDFAIRGTLLNDPKYVNMLQQEALFSGKPLDEVVNKHVEYYQKGLGAIRSGVMKSEQKLELSTLGGQQSIFEQNEMNKRNAINARIEKERNAIKMLELQLKYGNQDNNYSDTAPHLLGTHESRLPYKQVNLGEKNLPNAMTALASGNPKYDQKILRTIIENNPQADNSEIWLAYNESLKADVYAQGSYYMPFKTSQAQNEATESLIPRLNTPLAEKNILRYDPKTGATISVSSKELEELKSGMADGTSKVVGLTSPQTNRLPLGYLITGRGGKTYILPDDDERTVAMEKTVFPNAFHFITDPKQEIGGAFEIQSGGKNYILVGKKERKWNNKTKRVEKAVRYYTATYNESGELIPNFTEEGLVKDEHGNPWTPAHVQEALVGKQIRNLVPKNPISKNSRMNSSIENF